MPNLKIRGELADHQILFQFRQCEELILNIFLYFLPLQNKISYKDFCFKQQKYS